jgi:HSP20 family molecular chaperone IbpA
MKLLNLKAFNILFLFLILIFHSIVFAESKVDREEQIKRQLEEMLRARDEMLRSLLDDSAFSDFDTKFEDMIKRFNLQNFDHSGFDTDEKILGEYDWQESESERTFVLKVKQIKDRPLDIKIEKGKIMLKGDVEAVSELKGHLKKKNITKIHFERSISIPPDVDQSNPTFENKDGVLFIKFKKLVHPARPGSKPKRATQNPPDNSVDSLQPVSKDNNDLSI